MPMMEMLAHAGGGDWLPLVLPPLHPILVHFTAALVPVSLAADLFGRLSRRRSLTDTGWWTLVAATLVTPLTAAAGWYWLRQMQDMDHAQMPVHKWLGTTLATVLPLLLWARWRSYRAAAAPSWPYLSAAAIVVAAIAVQGHLGGTMTLDLGGDEGPAAAGPATPDGHGPGIQGMDMHAGHAPHAAPPASAPADPRPPAPGKINWRDHIDLPR